MRGYEDPVLDLGTVIIEGTRISVPGIRLDKVAGTGANAFVFGGEDTRLQRPVAVKIWPPRKDRPTRRHPGATDQALAEAAKVSRLKSEYLPTIFSASYLENGWPCVVMDYIDDVPLKDVRDDLPLLDRLIVWHFVYSALDQAERNGIYHGDLHGGNVLVRWFHATVIDFGTSAFAGRRRSLKRHARLIHRFVEWLLPELCQYVPSLRIPGLVRPEYVTYVENIRIEAAESLMRLDAELDDLSTEQVTQRLTYIANTTSTALIDMVTPIAQWLERRGVNAEPLAVYRLKATAEADRRRSQTWPNSVGLTLRPVPPFREISTA